jgi:hypothetical protein
VTIPFPKDIHPDIYKLKPPKKRSRPSSLIEIEGSDSEIEAEEGSAPDADSSNLDPVVEMDIDLHDFLIGQLEKELLGDWRHQKRMSQLRRKMYVSFCIENLTQKLTEILAQILDECKGRNGPST